MDGDGHLDVVTTAALRVDPIFGQEASKPGSRYSKGMVMETANSGKSSGTKQLLSGLALADLTVTASST